MWWGQLSMWLAAVHHAYGSWPLLVWAVWFEAWQAHVTASSLELGNKSKLLQWGWDLCPPLFPGRASWKR
ncbi:MAG: hypothetical protein A2Y74_04420 [Actinobacteria bacterium RBG_13_63_9]|nr:MAG: hypothetical protein A2Y74_04420 [Actinobacteria bacterium RBG_13_63_9]